MSGNYCTQNNLLLTNLLEFYNKNNNLDKILPIINGESEISLRLIDWFVTNYAKKNFTVYKKGNLERFKVYIDYKLKLKAYSKKRFDPFCRWDRINIPYKDNTFIQTTLGQLNFFRWALENEIIDYINKNTNEIIKDMNKRNSTSKKRKNKKERKRREELSVCASKSIKKEKVEIVVKFN
tara:strand:- start:1459 stop:1998 length:540 start_codon:yes stop_codon:yes gene_type:complete